MAQHAVAGRAVGRGDARDVPHPGMPSDAELVEALRLQLEAMLPPVRTPAAPGGDAGVEGASSGVEAQVAGGSAAALPATGVSGRPVADGAAPPDAAPSPAARLTPDVATLSLLDELDRLWARGGA